MGVALFCNHASMSIGSPFDAQMFTPLFPRLYDGILYDVFIQKVAVAWDNAPNSRIMVSLLLPGPMEADQWLHKVRANRHMWPLQMTSHPAANQLLTELFMRRERRRLQVRHIWVSIQPDWPMIKARVWIKRAILGFHTRCCTDASSTSFLKIYTRGQMSTESNGNGNAVEIGSLRKLLLSFRANGSALFTFKGVQVWHTKQGVFRRKLPPDVRDDPMRILPQLYKALQVVHQAINARASLPRQYKDAGNKTLRGYQLGKLGSCLMLPQTAV